MSRDLGSLVDGARGGSVRDIARLISLVEDASPDVPRIMATLASQSGASQVIGVTGAPGVGKSTFTSALITAYRSLGKRVGVLAVDPSSPFSGGALLGDRIRMQDHASDAGVYIRSMASRGHLGGLAATTTQALRVLEGIGFDIAIIETVGVGQSEVEIAGAADTTIVLLAPGMGDGIQAAKAGILEVGDVFVVNKADRDGADSTVRELRAVIALADRSGEDWCPPVLKTVAYQGEGITEVVKAIDDHRAWLELSGNLDERRVRRAYDELEAIVLSRLRAKWRADDAMVRAAERIAHGEIDSYSAAAAILDAT